MKLWAKSLRARLVGYFGLLSVVMTSGVGASAFLQVKNSLETNIYQQLETIAKLKEESLNNWFKSKKNTLILLSESEQFKEQINLLLSNKKNSFTSQENYQKLLKYINSNLVNQPVIKEFFIINDNGEVIFSNSPKNIGLDVKKQTYFSQIKNNHYGNNIYLSLNNNQGQITMTKPLINEQGKLTAIIGMHLNLSQINNIIFDPISLSNKGEAYLIDEFGLVFSHINQTDNSSEKRIHSSRIKAIFNSKNTAGIYINYQDKLVIGISHWLESLNLALVVEFPQKEAFLPAKKLAQNIIFIGLFISGLSTVIFYLIAQEITKPILAIKDTAIKICEGDLKAVAPILSEDEVGILAQAFNEMIDEFNYLYNDFQEQVTQLELAEVSAVYTYQELEKEKKKVERISNQLTQANEEINLLNQKLKSENLDLTVELQITNQRLTQFLDAIPVGIIVFDTQGKIYYANYKAKELLGENLEYQQHLYLAHSPKTISSDNVMVRQSLKLGESAHYDNIELHKQENIIPLESWSTPIFNVFGEIDYAIVAFQDISERKKIEQERQKFTENILKLNKANERFVPREFLQLLNKNSIIEVQLGDNVEREMSVLFSDIRNFTKLSENMTPTDNFRFINGFLSRLGPCITKYNGFIDKYIGDAIMALFGGKADDAIRAAIFMLKRLKKYNITRQRPERQPIQIGIGINTGLMMLGTVGSKNRIDNTVISDAVNLASRLETLTKDYSVSLLISQNTFVRLEDSNLYCIRLVDRVTVKGKSIPIAVYEVFDTDEPQIKEGKLANKTLFEQGISLYHLGQYPQAKLNFQECLKVNPDDKLCQIYLQRCSL